jgi:spoIIIJ-associated protein
VTGKTVDEATERALDQLGVAVGDAELIVVAEPKTGLFGRVREEARVRARVRPVGARPKRERSRRKPQGDRDRGGQRSSGGGSGGSRSASGGGRGGSGGQDRSSGTVAAADPDGADEDGTVGAGSANGGQRGGANGNGNGRGAGNGTSRSARRRRNRTRAAAGAASGGVDGSDGATGDAGNGKGPREHAAQRSTQSKEMKETVEMAEGMTLEEQGEAGRVFLIGLLGEYGIEGSVETRLLDEETVEIAATGEDLGMLVGPRGSTLTALQDLTRAVVQRQCPSRTDRILVDVAGYREKRSAALKRFSTQIAEEVIASGQEKALEPMSPADRKSVHDAVNDLDGVVTRSEGEDPNRHIVIAPAN